MDFIGELILSIYGIILVVILVILVFLIIRRRKVRKSEDFEKRNN